MSATKVSALLAIATALLTSLVIAASAAAATEPAFFECARVKGGAFANKSCTEAATSTKGKYEIVEGVGARRKISWKGSDANLRAGAGAEEERFELHCLRAKVAGEVTGPNTIGHLTITLNVCEEEAHSTFLCQSPGEKKGVVVLKPLSGSLGYIDEETKSVGIHFTPESGTTLVEFQCPPNANPKRYRLSGSVVSQFLGDVDTFTNLVESSYGSVDRLEGEEPALIDLLNINTAEEEQVTLTVPRMRGKGPEMEIKA